jgi:chromosome segregation ATPase
MTQPGPGAQQRGARSTATPQGRDLIGDLEGQIADGGRQITDKENQIKALQHEVALLREGNASLTAFHEELKASVSALGQAQNKAAGERDDARKVLPLAKEIAGRLAADHVRAIDRAVDAVEAESDRRRTEVDRRRSELAAAAGAEISAKAEVSAANAALADAKERLGDQARTIDAQTARVRSLKGAARDAESKNQDSLAYLLARDLEAAVAYLDTLLYRGRAETLQREAKAAWDRQAAAADAEGEASWRTAEAKEAMKGAEDGVTAHDKDRRKEIERLVAETEGAGPAADKAR